MALTFDRDILSVLILHLQKYNQTSLLQYLESDNSNPKRNELKHPFLYSGKKFFFQWNRTTETQNVEDDLNQRDNPLKC